ncbi:putative efflux protein, MATE family [Franzmannia pantelleriensis]|uniref:Multidrug export protein MepA n=1 Tax=Franzmannia pantelleriensis TaxID=48727 RepID=A0A1G9PFX3_9GAMM|nr:MATE family efflux transporter [Halomonas pantelleriensis]SDL97658.1 putative efflux protein, MATE family [Halomonas pantelleriensis]
MHSGSITRTYWRYTLPAVMALMVSGLYQVVDGIFIGHAVGEPGLAGITMAVPAVIVLLAVGLMLGAGAGAQCSIAHGRGDAPRAALMLGQGGWLLVLLGAPVGVILLFAGEAFVAFQGATGEVAQLSGDYLAVMAWGAPLVMASLALPFWVRNLGAPRLATLAMVTGGLANIAFDYVFILWLGWELQGAALATLLAESFTVLICVGFLVSRKPPIRLSWQPLRLSACRSVLSTGGASMVMYLYLGVVTVLHNMLLMHYGGAVQVAAYAITGYLLAFYYMFAEGVANGMQPLISYFHGARRRPDIKRVFRLGLYTGLGFGLVMVAALMLWPGRIVGIFISDDARLLAATTKGVRLHLFALFLDGFIVLAACFFQSMGMGRQAMLITLGNIVIQLPFLAVLPLVMGLNGVWLALPLSNLVLASVVLAMVRRRWQHLEGVA